MTENDRFLQEVYNKNKQDTLSSGQNYENYEREKIKSHVSATVVCNTVQEMQAERAFYCQTHLPVSWLSCKQLHCHSKHVNYHIFYLFILMTINKRGENFTSKTINSTQGFCSLLLRFLVLCICKLSCFSLIKKHRRINLSVLTIIPISTIYFQNNDKKGIHMAGGGWVEQRPSLKKMFWALRLLTCLHQPNIVFFAPNSGLNGLPLIGCNVKLNANGHELHSHLWLVAS